VIIPLVPARFPSLSAEAVQALTTEYREHPGLTIKNV
jgi:hypothetical protein